MLMDPQSTSNPSSRKQFMQSTLQTIGLFELELGGHDVLFVFYANNVNTMALWTEFLHLYTHFARACVVLSSYTNLRHEQKQRNISVGTNI